MANYIFRKGAEIGSLDAETDQFLNSCFFESDVYSNITSFSSDQNFKKRIIVGRTGSGKTAILKRISDSQNVKKSEIIEAETTVFEHIKNNTFISDLINNKIDLRVFYKSLWTHVLLVKIIEMIYPNHNSFYDFVTNIVGRKKYNPSQIKEYVGKYKDNFFNDNITTEITEKMQNDLSSSASLLCLKAKGKISTDAITNIQTTTSKYVSSELLKKQKEIIKLLVEEAGEGQNRIIISIDDLDKSWLSQSSIRYDFINSLLDSFKELMNIKSVKIIISMRTDILMGIYSNSLRQEEKDRSLIIPIEWNKNEIREILDKRIDYLIKDQYMGKNTVTLKDIFDFEVKNQDADEYIIQRTMLRPRDAIDFVNKCLSQGDGIKSLSEDNILEAEEKYYTSRKSALKKEWLSIYPHIEDYIDCLHKIDSQTFTLKEINEDKLLGFLMERSEANDDNLHNNIATSIQEVLKVWFLIGIIGIKKTKTLTIFSSFDKPALDITDYDKSFEIHPLFFRK